MSNIYISSIQIVPNNYKCEYLECWINSAVFFTLEDAIEYGKSEFIDMYDEYKDTGKKPSDLELEEFILENKINYSFNIKIVSGNRIKFNNSKELMDYYNNNVKDISNDDLFDFLLTLIDEYDINYDYKGNVISEEPQPQSFGSRVMSYHLDFSPESCSKGIIYGFDYSL